ATLPGLARARSDAGRAARAADAAAPGGYSEPDRGARPDRGADFVSSRTPVPAHAMTRGTSGASWLSPHCPICNSERGFPCLLPTGADESSGIGDGLWEWMGCGYTAVYRVGTGQFEPPKGQPREAWQPPLVWRTIAPVRPEAPNRPTPSARPTPTRTDSREHRGRHKQPAAAAAPQSPAAKAPKTAQDSKHELASAGLGEPLATETARGPSGDASIEAPPDFRKPRRTPAPDQPSSPSRITRRHKDRLRPRQA